MKIDLKKLQEMARQEKAAEEEKRSSNKSNSKYPLVYTGAEGRLTVKLLYSEKFGGIQRKVIRHDSGKTKVACMQSFGEDCPVCEAITNAEDIKGKEIGAWRKYGYKTRGICYAQIIDHDATYFKEEGDPKKGDVVLLMYPKTIYDQITDIIIKSGENLGKLVAENDSIPIVIEKTSKKGGFPTYTAQIFPFGSQKSFEDDAEMTGEQRYEQMVDSLDNLGEEVVPQYPSDEIRNSNRTLAETITAEFLGGKSEPGLVNPSDNSKKEESTPNNVQDNRSEESNQSDSNNVKEPENKNDSSNDNESVSTREDGMPSCYGKYEKGSKKCLNCANEMECFVASN